MKSSNPKMIGLWRDEIYTKTANGVTKEVIKGKNTLVQPYTTLMTMLLSNDSLANGILYHAIGKGDASWDTANPAHTAKVWQTALTDELNRKSPDSINYIKVGSGTASDGTTTTIVDPWRQDANTTIWHGRFEPDHYFDGMTVTITAGTNFGESRTVLDFDQQTGTITVSSPFSNPIDSTSAYEFTQTSSASATNAIEIRTTWDYGDPPFGEYIREQGLFGGLATATVDTGSMIDAIVHAKRWKDNSVKLVRYIDLIIKP